MRAHYGGDPPQASASANPEPTLIASASPPASGEDINARNEACLRQAAVEAALKNRHPNTKRAYNKAQRLWADFCREWAFSDGDHVRADKLLQKVVLKIVVPKNAKASSLIRSVKYNNWNSRGAFDRRRWLLSAPGMFHFQKAFVLSIVRTHWDSEDRDTLEEMAVFFGIFRLGLGNESNEIIFKNS